MLFKNLRAMITALLYILLLTLYLGAIPLTNPLYQKLTGFTYSFSALFPIDFGVFLILLAFFFKRKFLLRGKFRKANLEFLGMLFALIGIIPIFIGWMNGHENIFYDSRLYFYFLLAVAIPFFLDTSEKIYNFMKFFLLANGAVIIYTIVTSYIPRGFTFDYLINFRFLNMYCVLFLTPFLFKKQKTQLEKFFVPLFPLFFLTLIIDKTRSVYLGTMIGGGLIFLVSFKHLLRKYAFKILMALFLISLITGFILNNIWEDSFQRFLSSFDIEDKSVSARIDSIKSLINKFLESPLWGVGNGLRVRYYRPAKEKFYFGAFHAFYIRILTTGGLLCFVPFIFLLSKLVYKGWIATTRTCLEHVAVLSLGILAGFLGFLITVFFTVFSYNNVFKLWFFGGLTLSAYNIYLKEKRTKT